MFVWNHFTSDAWVMRERPALGDDGFNVNLIAIGNKRDKFFGKYDEINKKSKVYRPCSCYFLSILTIV